MEEYCRTGRELISTTLEIIYQITNEQKLSARCLFPKCAYKSESPQKAHRSPRDLLLLFYARAYPSEWGLFGHIARSAFRRTSSGPETRRELHSQYNRRGDVKFLAYCSSEREAGLYFTVHNFTQTRGTDTKHCCHFGLGQFHLKHAQFDSSN